MNKLLVAALIALLALGVWRFGAPRGPSLEEVKHLANPRVYRKEPQTVLVSQGVGDTFHDTARRGLGTLFANYFASVGFPAVGPTGRWKVLDPQTGKDVSADSFERKLSTEGLSVVGEFSLPAPATRILNYAALEEHGMKAATWDYGPEGQVAEILHVGPYNTEAPQIARLLDFIRSSGLEVAGQHEEEYLRGPGMLFDGDENSYLTLIRYPVKKATSRSG